MFDHDGAIVERFPPIAGARDGEPGRGADTPRMFSAAEFASRPLKPRPWLVPDLLPGAQVSSIDGDGGSGKTTLGLQLCASAVAGRSWLGQSVMRGPAIYLASEDDADELHRRLDAIAVDLGVSFADLADLHLWPLATDDPALVAAGGGDTVRPTARWEQLATAVERIKPVVVVLDSRADVFGGEEISRSQARGFIAMLRKLAVESGVAVVILGHPSLSGMSSGSGSSGSTHWRNAVRAGLYLRPEGDDAPADRKVLEVKKANYGPTGLMLKLRWCAGAYVLEDGGAPVGRAEAAAEVERTFLRLLDSYTAEGRPVSDVAGLHYAPTLFSRDPDRCGVTKAGFTAAMLRLLRAKAIRVEEVGPPSKRRRRIVPAWGDA
jgi:RecA-family ATPase